MIKVIKAKAYMIIVPKTMAETFTRLVFRAFVWMCVHARARVGSSRSSKEEK